MRRASGGAAPWPFAKKIGSTGVPNADDTLPPSGPTLQRAFEALVSTLNQRGIRYAIIGGIATLQHTRVRSTDDIDALLTVPQIALPGLFEALRDRGFVVDVIKCIREFRDEGLTTIGFGEVIIDLMRPVLPAYAHVLDRAIDAEVLGQKVRISTAEGLIVMKVIAMRPQDEADVREILAAYQGNLDLAYIRAELEQLMPADDPRRVKFESWLQETNRRE